VLKKQAAQQEWRQQQGVAANRAAPGEPLFISISEVATRSDADFASLPALSSTQHGMGHSAESLAAFLAGLERHPAWQQLMADAKQWRNELGSQLPEELRPEAGGKPRLGKAKK
jgi:hypothetical protein